MAFTVKYLIIAMLYLSIAIWQCEAQVTQRLILNDNFTLDFGLKDKDNTTMEFVLETKTAGWVGIGFNYKAPTMLNADYFVGFVDGTGGHGGDYHIVPGDTHPHGGAGGSILHVSKAMSNIQDQCPNSRSFQNWEVINGTEVTDPTTQVTTTRLMISRSLDTEDAKYDHKITSSTLHLIWAYNSETDDITQQHSVMGSEKINLLTGNINGEIGDGDGGDTSDIGKEGDGGNGGASMISIGISTLFLTLTVSVIKWF